jgi:hypothetical protein
VATAEPEETLLPSFASAHSCAGGSFSTRSCRFERICYATHMRDFVYFGTHPSGMEPVRRATRPPVLPNPHAHVDARDRARAQVRRAMVSLNSACVADAGSALSDEAALQRALDEPSYGVEHGSFSPWGPAVVAKPSADAELHRLWSTPGEIDWIETPVVLFEGYWPFNFGHVVLDDLIPLFSLMDEQMAPRTSDNILLYFDDAQETAMESVNRLPLPLLSLSAHPHAARTHADARAHTGDSLPEKSIHCALHERSA